ncbi:MULTISPECIES: DUF5134 domain-containing protein [Streptomyces]|uniref:DUF5134 domain-containing protein n=1 Tax=Streptomyces TaxID=1883 RepID=UPI001646E8D9|nr:DUF5134 domain-containing protein [Streptomyces salinarius]
MSAIDTVYGMLSVLFAAAAVHGLRRTVLSKGSAWRERLDHLLHTAMALAMAVMPWSWGRVLPEPPQTAFFAAAALWFLLSARDSRPGTIARRLPHAAGMAAMAWMSHSMAASSHETLAGGLSAAHHAAGSGHHAEETTAGDAVAATLALFLLAYALWSLTRDMPALRTPRPPGMHGTGASGTRHPYAHFWEGSMALGTAVMLLMPH